MRYIFGFIIVMMIASGVNAATFTSTGSGGNWTSPSTWTNNNGYPQQGDIVVIKGPVVVNANSTCFKVTIDNGGTLSFGAAGYTLTLLNNNWWETPLTNNGTFNAGNGTVEYKSTSNVGINSGSNLTFYHVKVTGISQMVFNSNTLVMKRLTLTSGNITSNPAYTDTATLELNGPLNLQSSNAWASGSGNTVAPNIVIASGTITFDNGVSRTVKKKLTINSGATFSMSNACLTLASTFEGIVNNGTATFGGIIVSSGAVWNLNNNYTLSTLQIQNGATVNAHSYTLTLHMNNNSQCGGGSNIFTMSSGGTFNAGTGTVVLKPVDWNGVSANVSGGVVFNNVVVEGPNTLNIPNTNTMTVNGSITVNNGATVNQPHQIIFGSNATITNNGSTTNGSFPSTIPSGVSGNGGGSASTPIAVVSPNVFILTSNLTIDGSRKVMIIQPGAEMVANAYSITADSIYVYGKLTLTNSNGLDGFLGSTKILVGSSSTIEYAATSGTQIITLRTDYVNMILSGGASKRFGAGTYEIAGDFTASNAPNYNSGTIMRFDGINQEIACPSFNTVEFTNSGTKSLTVATSIHTLLTLAGTTTLATGGNLTLVSNASGTASVATIPAGSTITGDVTVQRYVPAVARRSRIISPNTTNFTYNDLKDDMFVTGAGGASNGFDASGPNQTTVYTYQESTSGGRGWKAIPNINASLPAGAGALVFVRGDRSLAAPAWYTAPYVAQNEVTIDFVGPINIGTFSPALTYTNTGSSADDGWNMLGNPYPSAISWNSIGKNNLSPFYYVFNPQSNGYEAMDGTVPIASGQGFFVQAIGANPSITFTENCKTVSTPSYYFKTALAPMAVRMVKDSVNSDVAFLRFSAQASKAFDVNEDALKMTNSGINFGFSLGSATMVQYNTVPFVTTADTFLLSATASTGSYTLEFSQLAIVPAAKNVYLRDLFTNTITDIRATSSYPFSITSDPASKGNRFQLIIIDPSALPVTWLNVSAQVTNQDVIVRWSTVSEKNNAGFILERSADAEKWVAVQAVDARGDGSTVNNYSYTDQQPFYSVNRLFYRIRQTDHNGDVSYSGIVGVENKKAEAAVTVHVFPNPATTDLTIAFPETHTEGSLEVYDLFGKLVLKKELRAGARSISLEVSDLPAGIYTVQLPACAGMAAGRFIKQ